MDRAYAVTLTAAPIRGLRRADFGRGDHRARHYQRAEARRGAAKGVQAGKRRADGRGNRARFQQHPDGDHGTPVAGPEQRRPRAAGAGDDPAGVRLRDGPDTPAHDLRQGQHAQAARRGGDGTGARERGIRAARLQPALPVPTGVRSLADGTGPGTDQPSHQQSRHQRGAGLGGRRRARRQRGERDGQPGAARRHAAGRRLRAHFHPRPRFGHRAGKPHADFRSLLHHEIRRQRPWGWRRCIRSFANTTA